MDPDSVDYFRMGYVALGGLGLFFLGLRYLSDYLQRVTGEFIQKLIAFATTNRVLAVLAGALVTALIQSSSISTVMVVGMVNAGLMNLTQAIGVILGANIGTTTTGWILAVNIGKYGLLFIGLGFVPLLFSKRPRLSALGGVVLALGLIFFGLELMSGAFSPLRSNETFIGYLALFDTSTVQGLLGCVVVGCILTFVIQSSSGMLGITIALAASGGMEYSTAAALVLGENIGTTITAILASLGVNTSARRAAISHSLFNVTGVTIMLLLFEPYIALVDYLVPGDPNFVAPDGGGKPNIAAHIAMGHTLFNVTAVCLMLPFLGPFSRFVERLIPGSAGQDVPTLRYLGRPGQVSSDVTLNMAILEIRDMAKLVHKAFAFTDRYIRAKEHDADLMKEVGDLEEHADTLQKEITAFVCQAMEGKLDREQAQAAYSIIRSADELETLTDYCYAVCRYRYRLHKKKQDFSEAGWEDVFELFARVTRLFELVSELFEDYSPEKAEYVPAFADSITNYADQLRENHLERMRIGACKPLPALAFSDLVIAMRRIKNHSMNLYEAFDFEKSVEEEAMVG